MKNAYKYLFMLTALAAGSLVAIGCSQSAENNSSADATSDSETSVVAKTDGECCGNCATEQVAAGQAEACCGKCSGESAVSSKAEDCCGKCAGETAVATSKTTEAGCEGECNACAEGDSANCKCGDTPKDKPADGN